MSTKLKALGLSLLAVMAASAVVVMNASAESQVTGHFTSDAASTKLDVIENPPNGLHMLEFDQPGFKNIACHETSYAATISGTTVTDITVTPTFKGCLTTGGVTGEVTIHTNGCVYTLTQINKEAAKTEHTFDLVCPAGKTLEITHSGCTITIHSFVSKGIGYTTTNEALPGEPLAKHSITVTLNVGFPLTRHGGFCALLATNSTGTLTGSATVFGTNAATGKQVGITATGSIN